MIYIRNDQTTQSVYIPKMDITVTSSTIYATEAYVNEAVAGLDEKKQDKLISGQNIKTINGESILGEGNIVIEGGSGGTGTKYAAGDNIEISEDNVISVTGITVPSKVSELTNDSGYLTESDLEGKNYVTDTELEGKDYVTNSELNGKGYVTNSDLGDYVTDTELTNAVSGFVTSAQVETQIESKGYVSESELTSKDYVSESELTNALSGYVTSGQVESQIENKGYATSGYVNSQLSNYVSESELNEKGYMTDDQVSMKLQNYATTASVQDFITESEVDTKLNDYTPTSGFASINGSAITNGGNLVIDSGGQVAPYKAGTNIDISEDYTISVTGISVPVNVSQLANDAGYVTNTELEGKNYVTESELNGKGYVTNSDLGDYVTDTELTNAVSGFVTSGQVEEQITSKGYITNSALEGYVTDSELTNAISGFVSSAQVETQIETKNYVSESELTSKDYVTNTELNSKGYITNSALEGYVTDDDLTNYTPTSGFASINGSAITNGGNLVIDSGGQVAPYRAGTNIEISDDYTISVTGISVPTNVSQLTNDAGYVTSGQVEEQITSKGYITNSALDGYVTDEELNGKGYLVESDLANYPTDTDLSNAISGFVSSAQVETQITSKDYVTNSELNGKGYVTNSDLGDYVTDDELNGKGYLVESDLANYPTDTDLSNAISGYVTSAQVETQITNKDYVTNTELNGKGYVTNSDLGDYVTDDELNGKGYITNTELEGKNYVTDSELTSELGSYATTAYVDSIMGTVNTQLSAI